MSRIGCHDSIRTIPGHTVRLPIGVTGRCVGTHLCRLWGQCGRLGEAESGEVRRASPVCGRAREFPLVKQGSCRCRRWSGARAGRGVTGAPWNGGEALGVVVRVGREGGEVGRTAGCPCVSCVFLAAAKHASGGPAGPQRPPRVDCLPARRGRRRVLHVFPAAPSADEREDACDGHDHQSAANSAGNR